MPTRRTERHNVHHGWNKSIRISDIRKKDTENREVFTKKTGVEDLSDRKTENQKLFSEERIRPSHTVKAHWWKRKYVWKVKKLYNYIDSWNKHNNTEIESILAQYWFLLHIILNALLFVLFLYHCKFQVSKRSDTQLYIRKFQLWFLQLWCNFDFLLTTGY